METLNELRARVAQAERLAALMTNDLERTRLMALAADLRARLERLETGPIGGDGS